MSEGKKLEGEVISINLIGSMHNTGGLSSRKIPNVRVLIKNSSGREESVEMPMDVGDGQLIRGAMINQAVIFEREDTSAGGYTYITKKLLINSGQCRGAQYKNTEEY